MQLRTLTENELSHVSGGDGSTSIIITAQSLSNMWGSGLDIGMGDLIPDQIGNDTPTGGGGDVTAQWLQIGQIVVGFIAGYLAERAVHAAENESRVAETFHPNEVVSNVDGMVADGSIDHGWLMQDGSMFFDTDHNGIPDLHLWTDPAGNVWSDTGSGKTLIKAAG